MELLPQKWNSNIQLKSVTNEESLQRVMKQDILDVVEKFQLKMGGAHHPREIPLGVWIFTHELAKASLSEFKAALEFVVSQSGCVEGVLQLATDRISRR
jgi:hypothetical protein